MPKFIHIYYYIVLVAVLAQPCRAQRHEVLADNLRTLLVEAGGDGNSLPVLTLGSGETLRISFDDMTHEYRRYTYHIEHLTWDFRPTDELFDSEYVRTAADEEVIEDYEESMNTVVNYTHYTLDFPNDRMQPLVSGNYRLIISTENDVDDREEVIRVYFSVLDPQATVALRATTNTDVDWNATHQQVEMEVDLRDLVVRDAATEVKTVVLQNRRWDNAAINPAPTYTTAQRLIWKHCRALIFPAGNEFRSFENISTRYPGMNIERVGWREPFYHAAVFPDAPRRNYLHMPDRNGQFVPATADSPYPDTESEYVYTHFLLETDELPGQDIYICGQWTHDRFLPGYQMHYDEELQGYAASLFLKQGYYSYQYLAVPRQGKRAGQTAPAEGDFWQTENEYAAYVYYRRTGDRYWRLVGHTAPSFRP